MKRLFCMVAMGLCLAPTLVKGATRQEVKRVTPARPAARCDLVISAIELTDDCRLRVTIQNRGPGGLPDAAYDRGYGAAVQASVNNSGWGGYRLFMIDPEKRLQKAGSSVSYEGFRAPLAAGATQVVKMVIVDPRRTANESSTTNNSLTKRLACGKAGKAGARLPPAKAAVQARMPTRLKPDLVIKMIKMEPAQPTIHDNIRFSAYVHNQGAVTAEPSTAAIKVGGESAPRYFSKPAITPHSSNAIVRLQRLTRPGKYRVTFQVDVSDQVDEADENNNIASLDFIVTKTRVVSPAVSQTTLPAGQFQLLPDLAVTNVVTNSDCFLQITMQNQGGPIPATVNRNGIKLAIKKNGMPYGETMLNWADPSCQLCQPNGTVTYTHGLNNNSTFPGNVYLEVKVDASDQLKEGNENNNVMIKQNHCPVTN